MIWIPNTDTKSIFLPKKFKYIKLEKNNLYEKQNFKIIKVIEIKFILKNFFIFSILGGFKK